MTSILDTAETAEVVRLRDVVGLTWAEIDERYPGINRETLRTRYRRVKTRGTPPQCEIVGLTPADFAPDEEEVYQRATQVFSRSKRLVRARGGQVLSFNHGPVALAFLADQHFGDEGTDYERAFEEAEMVAKTPGMYAALVGDLVNNYVIGRLAHVRFSAPMSIPDELALLKRYLRILADKLKLMVMGNHDWWTKAVSGIDYMQEVADTIVPHVLYDPSQIDVMLLVGGKQYPGRIRHAWRGRSIYNDTHGIERAYKWDPGDPAFMWAVGAHTHTSGLVREFNAGGETGLAMLCGSYKRDDSYARRLGFPQPNQSTAVVIVFSEQGMLGFSDLQAAVNYMELVYGDVRPVE